MEKLGKYLTNNWKNYIYIILNSVSQGYWYYSQFRYPERKKEKWLLIDKKIIEKYQTNITKDQRYRRKKKNLANYRFFRWNEQCILLKTEGERILADDEPWSKLQGKNKIIIPVNSIIFEIQEINKKFSVKISKKNLKEIKTSIKIKLEKKLINQAIYEIEKLSNLPNYQFLKRQKQESVKYFIEQHKIHLGNPGKALKEKLKNIINKQVPLRKLPLFVKAE